MKRSAAIREAVNTFETERGEVLDSVMDALGSPDEMDADRRCACGFLLGHLRRPQRAPDYWGRIQMSSSNMTEVVNVWPPAVSRTM